MFDLCPDSEFVKIGGDACIETWVQGFSGNTNHMPGNNAALAIRGQGNIHNVNPANVHGIQLNSCFSAAGGRFSNDQVIANKLDIPVTGFYRKVSMHNVATTAKCKTFYSIIDQATKDRALAIKKAIFSVSETLLTIPQRFAGLQRHIREAESIASQLEILRIKSQQR